MQPKPAGALAGVGFAILGVLGAAIYPDAPDFVDSPEAIAAFYVENSGEQLPSDVLYLFSGALLIVFLGYLLAASRAAEGGPGRTSFIAFGGGIAGVACMLASATADAVAALRVEEQDTIEPATATALFDLSIVLYGLAAPFAIAVLVLATARLAFTSGLFPTWHGGISIVLGIALLIPPISWVAIIVFTLWVLVTAVLLYMRPPQATATAV